MKNKLWQIWQFFLYLIRCLFNTNAHSDFTKNLHDNLFKEKAKFYAFDEIESIRAKLLLTQKEIEVEDLGAGSNVLKSQKRKISSIAKTSLKPAKQSQLLFRFIRTFQPKTTLELGTCLGITSAYLAKANPKGILITLEGSKELAKVARINLDKLKVANFNLIEGNFNDTLAQTLTNLKQVDFVFFDGNHQQDATIEYFKEALNCTHENSIFVFDDIYWSKGMTKAWQQIKKHQSVAFTIDCFSMGFVFFDRKKEKGHFTVYH